MSMPNQPEPERCPDMNGTWQCDLTQGHNGYCESSEGKLMWVKREARPPAHDADVAEDLKAWQQWQQQGKPPAPDALRSALQYALALMRNRLDVEAPMNAAVIRGYIGELEAILSAGGAR